MSRSDEVLAATAIMRGTVRDRFSVIEPFIRTGAVLEVGCVDSRPQRQGTPSRLKRKADLLFRRIAEANADVLGIDIDAEGIAILKDEGYNVQCVDAASMDLGRRFDTIVAGEVIEHVDNVGLFLRSLAAHLKPDGVLAVTTPNPFYCAQTWRILRFGRPRVNEGHTAWFDPITLQAAMKRAALVPFEGHWVQPKRSLLKTWRRLLRRYFSHSFVILARRAS
jgi:2-polyprenyl-3-methyl-5-hydroxy-6-metoxy-1,4-benzoquinol methylase